MSAGEAVEDRDDNKDVVNSTMNGRVASEEAPSTSLLCGELRNHFQAFEEVLRRELDKMQKDLKSEFSSASQGRAFAMADGLSNMTPTTSAFQRLVEEAQAKERKERRPHLKQLKTHTMGRVFEEDQQASMYESDRVPVVPSPYSPHQVSDSYTVNVNSQGEDRQGSHESASGSRSNPLRLDKASTTPASGVAHHPPIVKSMLETKLKSNPHDIDPEELALQSAPLAKPLAVVKSCSNSRSLQAPQDLQPCQSPKSPTQRTLNSIVFSSWFERVVHAAILLNAIYMGVVTHITAHNRITQIGVEQVAIEILFFVFFVSELTIRAAVHGFNLFRQNIRLQDGSRMPNSNYYWNILDTLVITLQLVELIFSNASSSEADSGAEIVGTFQVVRLLRLVRIIRIVRIVKVSFFVHDLRMIVYAIWRSLSLFFWSIMSLGLFTFVYSVYFTEMVLAQYDPPDEESDRYFGDLFKTMLSLLQAVTGGIDWVTLTDVLARCKLGIALGVLPFLFYVLFTIFSLLNVMTGVFLETAMESAKEERELYVVRNAQKVFAAADHNRNGMIAWDDFRAALEHDAVINFFDAVDIHISEAKSLFELLDVSGDNTISSDEFLNGCLRVRGPAKALDLLVLSREVSQLFEKHAGNAESVAALARLLEDNRQEILINRNMQFRNAVNKVTSSRSNAADDTVLNGTLLGRGDASEPLACADQRGTQTEEGSLGQSQQTNPQAAMLPGECSSRPS